MMKFLRFIFLACCCVVLLIPSYSQPFSATTDNFVPVYSGPIQWADLDNDQDLDIIYSGFTQSASNYFTKVYENVNGSFVDRTTALPDLRNGAFALGDYDNDGDLDVLIGGLSLNNPVNICELYENKGAFLFVRTYAFPGLMNINMSWADIDNDQDLDFVYTGIDDQSDDSNPLLGKIYVFENKNGLFTHVPEANLPPCTQCSMDWADSDGDGRVDLIITGLSNESGVETNITALYLNNGDNTFRKDNKSTLHNRFNGSVKWGDFDNDGDMDLLSSGEEYPSLVTTVYENREGILIERSDIKIAGTGENWFGGVKWIDFNNDGLLDIAVSGRGESVITSVFTFKLYKNKGHGVFEEIIEPALQGISDVSIDIGDYDNDGDMDFCFLGINFSGIVTGIYENKLLNGVFSANSKPSSPPSGSLYEKFFRKEIVFNWSDGEDEVTSDKALSYNIYLKNSTDITVMPPSNILTGYQNVLNPYNGKGKKYTVRDLKEGSYLWAVQSIDGAKVGSSFSAEKSFYLINGPETKRAAIIDGTKVKISWFDNSQVETGYYIERSLNPLIGFPLSHTLSENTDSFIDESGFVTDTYYYYRIFAGNANRMSAYDSSIVLIPTAPSSISGQSLNVSVVNLSWSDNSSYETAYHIERRIASSGEFEVIARLAKNSTSYQNIGLTGGTSYEYRVCSVNEYGNSVYSNWIDIKTNSKPLGNDFVKEGYEDNTILFSLADFTNSFSDNDLNDNLVRIVVKTLPQKGVLKLKDVAVLAGQTIPSSDLSFLQFIPLLNANGPAQFEFYNSDGKDNSALNYKVSLNLIAVNDAPTFTIKELIELEEGFTESIRVKPTPLPIPYDELTQIVTYSIQPDKSDIVSLNFDTKTGELVINSLPDKFGEASFVITANDGQQENNTYSKSVKIVIQHVEITGLAESSAQNIKIYPNPVSSSLCISIDENIEQPFNLIVTDLLGRAVFNTLLVNKDSHIDLESLSAGIYLLRIIKADGADLKFIRLTKK